MAKKNPPKVGEIRIGRAGNKYNKWDGKRWVPVSAARTAGASGRKASVVSKAVPSKAGTGNTSGSSTAKAQYVPMTTRTKKPTMAQPKTPQAKLTQLQRGLNAQTLRKRGIEAKRQKTAAEAAELKKINAEIARIRKALG